MRLIDVSMESIPQTLGALEAVVDEITRRLVTSLYPERVYLFGSRARGDQHDGSDYDFMVIVPDEITDAEYSRLRHAATECLRDIDVYHDLKVWKREYFDRQVHLRAAVPGAVVREGQLLYCKSGCEPFLVREASGPGEDDPAVVSNVREWMTLAHKDLRVARYNSLAPEDFSVDVLFYCQQASEKVLKAYLSYYDIPFPKTHELDKLGELCPANNDGVRELVAGICWLSNWSVAGRYLGASPEDATALLAKKGLEQATGFAQSVVQRLPIDFEM